MQLTINTTRQDLPKPTRKSPSPASEPAVDAGATSRMLRFQTALVAMRDAEMDDLSAFVRLVTEQAAHALDAARVGFWRLNPAADAITGEDLFVRETGQHQSGNVVAQAAFPLYFKAIREQVAIRADDALHHPATQELADAYLQPLGISSILDVPVKRGGVLKGVVCIEHIGPSRVWGAAEENFAIAVAGMVALAIEHAKRVGAESQLKDLNRQLQQLVAQRTQDLQESEERFKSIFEYSSMLVILTSTTDGTVTEINPAALAATGRTWPEAIGQRLEDLGIDLASAQPALPAPSAAMPGRPVPMQVQLRRASGEPLTLLGSCRSLAIGRTMHWLYCLQDITERELARRALDELTGELERRVEERTAALMDAKSAAERASAIKSRFLSNMSHELRTPLNAILGFAQLLGRDLQSGLSLQQQRFVGEIHLAGSHLLALINDVLDLSRIEEGKLSISREPVDLAQVVGECSRLLEPIAASRQVTMYSHFGPLQQPFVLADRVRLKQVLVNLMSNAIKFNRVGGAVRLIIATDAQGLRVTITDDGPGLDADQRARLFQPFERLDADRAGVDGTGIGLALCRQLVETMDGEIGVDSLPGCGCSFWFSLPEATQQPRTAPAIASRPGPSDAGAPLVVLYIEDNPVNVVVMQSMLARLSNCCMVAAELPELGLRLALAAPPDLILLDIHLPGMDGYEVLRRLRANPVTRQVPVLAVSANAASGDFEQARSAGFSGYLTKPLDIDTLLAAVTRHARCRQVEQLH